MNMNENNSEFLKVSIVDDHQVVVESLSRMINDSDFVRVIGNYYDLKSCREGLARELPDILLLDIELPDGDGVDFCAEAVKKYPGLKVIMLTGYKEFNIAKCALRNGAHGYVLKHVSAKEMFAGIKTVCQGETFLCEEIDLLLKDNRKVDAIWLTGREKEILGYISNGYTVKKIADTIHRKEDTVKSFKKILFKKFNVNNIAELVKKASDMKLI